MKRAIWMLVKVVNPIIIVVYERSFRSKAEFATGDVEVGEELAGCIELVYTEI